MGSHGVLLNQEGYGTVNFPSVGARIQVDLQNSIQRHPEGVWINILFSRAPL